MPAIGFGRSAALRPIVGAGLVALLAIGGTACGGDDSAGSDESDAPAPVDSGLLGEPNAASGAPVKVGLITDGGDCAECSTTGGQEQSAAEATVQWINEYQQGLAGRPMELQVCLTDLDPARASDCANQMIADDVVAVVIGSSGVIEASWAVLRDAGVPVINFSATQPALLEDEGSTFILQDSDVLTVNLPLETAKAIDTDKVSVIVVDMPIASEAYEGPTPGMFEDEGLELNVVPVPLGAPDMTPQAQELVADNPDGLVMIVGHDQFCIPAIKALQAVGFTGTIATISHCVTDAMRDAIPSDVLDGIVIAATAPIGDDTDESMQQYAAVLAEYGASDIDIDGATPLSVFSSFAALGIGTQGLQGEVTPESVIAALRAMPNEVLPGTGGRHFRCDGSASQDNPAVCTTSLLSTTLDAEGNPADYEVLADVAGEG